MKKFLIGTLSVLLTLVGYQQFRVHRAYAQSTSSTRLLYHFITGSDAAYTTLLTVDNTGTYSPNPGSSSPTQITGVTGTCTADAYYNGTHYGPGSLGTFPAGTITTLTEAQVGIATGLSLANSGQRAYVFLTCAFPYAHGQSLLVGPGGAVSFYPASVIAPTRSAANFPEQLLP